jgi:SAM-dependent methyltransferase
MSVVFDEYARFYDNLYHLKDYGKEVDYVLALVHKAGNPRPKSVLDIGCGTAKHVIPFAQRGMETVGFDLSSRMVEAARANIKDAGVNAHVNVGDALTYRDKKKYDLVVSMFAVMGYLNANEDFLKGLETARVHMHTESLFIFDVWFGPAVLHQKPEVRVQEHTAGDQNTMRIVRPEINICNQTVTVAYDVMKFNDEKKVIEEAHEKHTMRYFFAQEMKLFLTIAGLEMIGIYPFMDTDKEPTENDWNIAIVSKPA